MTSVRRRSALSTFLTSESQQPAPVKVGVQLTEIPFGYLNLRGNAADSSFVAGLEKSGIHLPIKPNTVTENGPSTVLWLGPDEWVLITPPGCEGELAATLRQSLQNALCALTDITHGQTTIRLCGPKAIDVLSKGCSLDVHHGSFGPGCCAQTHLAKAGITIRWVDDAPSFDLIVRRSFAEYLALWLKDASEEYGFATR